MNTIREVEQINQQELERGIAGTPASWHAQYRNSPWVYVGNLDHQLTEGMFFFMAMNESMKSLRFFFHNWLNNNVLFPPFSFLHHLGEPFRPQHNHTRTHTYQHYFFHYD